MVNNDQTEAYLAFRSKINFYFLFFIFLMRVKSINRFRIDGVYDLWKIP